MKHRGKVILVSLSITSSLVFLIAGNIQNPFIYIFSFTQACIAWLIGGLYDRYKFLSFNDYLTKVYNRRYGYKVIPKLLSIAKHKNESLAILNIDINNFKCLNDNYGHHYGDLILKELTVILQDTIRKNDLLIRWGGDEFLIISQNVDRESADKIVQRINKVVQQGLNKYMKDINIQLSIGYAIFPEDGDTFDHLVSIADDHMYEVKATYKNSL